MAHNLTIKLEGSMTPLTDQELRLEATGMAGPGWEYTWRVRDAKGKLATGSFTHKSKSRKVVVWRLPEEEGLFHVEVTAKKGSEQRSVETQIRVLPSSLRTY